MVRESGPLLGSLHPTAVKLYCSLAAPLCFIKHQAATSVGNTTHWRGHKVLPGVNLPSDFSHLKLPLKKAVLQPCGSVESTKFYLNLLTLQGEMGFQGFH